MSYRVGRPLLFLFLVLGSNVAVVQARALWQGHTIRGKVQNVAGLPLSHVTVDLHNGQGASIGQTVTSNEGDFAFSGLTDTSFVVHVSVADYLPVAERVEFVNFADASHPGESRRVEITLVPHKGARIPPARSAFAQNVPPLAREAYDRSLKLSREGKDQEALAALRDAVKVFPDYFDARFALGTRFLNAGKLHEATEEFEQSRRINPKDDRVYQSFALILMRQKKFALAARVFAEAAMLNPKDPMILLRRAEALINHAAMLDPNKSKIVADERVYALNEAEKSLKLAASRGGATLLDVHLQMARVHERRGEKARAAKELEEYLRKNPSAPNARALREAITQLRNASATP